MESEQEKINTNNNQFEMKEIENLKEPEKIAPILPEIANQEKLIVTTCNNSQILPQSVFPSEIPKSIQSNSLNANAQPKQVPTTFDSFQNDPKHVRNDNPELFNMSSMDPYAARPTPVKPIQMAEPYPSTSPPRLLSLEPTNAYARNPYPKNTFDPKLGRTPVFIDPRISMPFPAPPNLRGDMNTNRPIVSHHAVNYQPPPYYHQPSYLRGAPFRQEQFLPQPSLSRPPVTNIRAPVNSSPSFRNANPSYQTLSAPPNYFPPHQSGYYPAQPNQNENVHLSQNYPPPYPPQYSTYYPQNAGPSSNGAFMIHNLLQHRAIAEDNTGTPLAEEEIRNIGEFSSYMTHE